MHSWAQLPVQSKNTCVHNCTVTACQNVGYNLLETWCYVWGKIDKNLQPPQVKSLIYKTQWGGDIWWHRTFAFIQVRLHNGKVEWRITKMKYFSCRLKYWLGLVTSNNKWNDYIFRNIGEKLSSFYIHKSKCENIFINFDKIYCILYFSLIEPIKILNIAVNRTHPIEIGYENAKFLKHTT